VVAERRTEEEVIRSTVLDALHTNDSLTEGDKLKLGEQFNRGLDRIMVDIGVECKIEKMSPEQFAELAAKWRKPMAKKGTLYPPLVSLSAPARMPIRQLV
jgi:hypothetical protein